MLLPVLLIGLVALLGVEVYRTWVFYENVTAGAEELRTLRDRLDVEQMDRSEELLLADRAVLELAKDRLEHARRFVDGDPLVQAASLLPFLGPQVEGVWGLVHAGEQSVVAGLDAVDLALAFARYEPDAAKSSIQEAVAFLEGQSAPLEQARASLDALKATREGISQDLAGPLAKGRDELDAALSELDSLVSGYERAQIFLPELLGYDGERRYLLLPQNNAELFASGGLISSYGTLTLDHGHLDSVKLEYFGTLFERWQNETGEYVEPPEQLKNYLKKDYSWGLGEAGWYPDFETTALLASDFVSRGGGPETDGVIAIDMHFMRALLGFLGPVGVAEYDAVVDATNFDEVALTYTRNEAYEPGRPKKAFLSYLAREVMARLLATPKDRWVELVSLLDRMGRERHLQLQFDDPDFNAISQEYGFSGNLRSAAADYLLIADTSVNSTKLNLILETEAELSVSLSSSGDAISRLSYSIRNPFPQWEVGRDTELVRALMLDGVYGSYLRIYVPRQASLDDVLLDGRGVGVEQVGLEAGRAVFGRFFRVLPGDTATVRFEYSLEDVVLQEGDEQVYRLVLRKQAGTDSVPMSVQVALPPGAELIEVKLDGAAMPGMNFDADLSEDRRVEVRFRLPS